MKSTPYHTSKEDTQEQYDSFYKILRKNIKFKHGLTRLPKIPYFLKSCTNPKIEGILSQLLYDSKFNTKEFLDKATLILLLHREEKENQSARLSSLVREDIDIRNKLKYIDKDSTSKSQGKITMIDSFSSLGTVSITCEIAGLLMNIGQDEAYEGSVDVTSDVEINVFLLRGDDSEKIDEFKIYFGATLQEVHYLSLVDKRFFTKLYSKGDDRYRITLEVKIELSERDKWNILMQHLYDIEQLIEREKEVDDLYQILLDQFGIIDKEREIKSKMIEPSKRDCCGLWPC
jgi:hypothetical protein